MSKVHKYELHVQPLTPTPIPESIPSAINNVVKQLLNLVSKDIRMHLDSHHLIKLSADAEPVAVKTRPIP